MGNIRKLKRGLKQNRVWIAKKVEHEQKLIQEATTDPEKAKTLVDKWEKTGLLDGYSTGSNSALIGMEAHESPKGGFKDLPSDPLIEGNAPESNYPENQGLKNAFLSETEKQKILSEELKS